MLQQVYSGIRGDWTLALEKEFQELRGLEATMLAYQNDPGQRAELLRQVPAEKWRVAWKRYDGLRFTRLCHYLRVRPADADIGHSIFIFRLDAAEIAAATGGSVQNWRDAIERAVQRRRPTARTRPAAPGQPRSPG
jgi:hypothetical protein